MNGVKIELDQNSLLLMNEKNIQITKFLNSITFTNIGKKRLFRLNYLKHNRQNEDQQVSDAHSMDWHPENVNLSHVKRSLFKMGNLF